MARQEGIILLTGPVGNLSFYKMNGEYFARRKSGVSGERIKSEPAYARTRENIAEFGRASLSTKLFRRAFDPLVRSMGDARVTGRLTAAMLRVIKSDEVNLRGQRRVSDGESALLKGFELNRNCKLRQRFLAPCTASIDRATGVMSVEIPAFIPSDMVSAPAGATHFRLKASGAAIDFDADRYTAATSDSTEIAITDTQQERLKLTVAVSPSADPMFLLFGIEFFTSTNGRCYPLSDNANAMAILNVDDSTLPEVVATTKKVAVAAPVLTKKVLTDRKPIPFNRSLMSNLEHTSSVVPSRLLSHASRINARDG